LWGGEREGMGRGTWLLGGLSQVGDGSLGAEDVDELLLVGVDVSLHYVHARSKHSLKRCHVQY